MQKKNTKVDYLNMLRELVWEADSDLLDLEMQQNLIKFIDRQLEILELHKNSNTERKRVVSDALGKLILERMWELTDKGISPMTIDEIFLAFEGDEDITKKKVGSYLGKMVKEGIATKKMVRIHTVRKMVYTLTDKAREERKEERQEAGWY